MSDAERQLRTLFERHQRLFERVRAELAPQILRAYELLDTALAGGHKVLLCGNGGSAADAQHFAAELVGRFGRPGPPLPALALTVDTSVLTALANDLGYEEVFARQIDALGEAGDVLVAISTSGRSANVLRAAAAAAERGLAVVALVGETAAEPLAAADVRLAVPSADTQRIQEMHAIILHAWGELLIPGSSTDSR